jgi:tRNA (cmo5U34)-methyltransferase
MSHEPRPTDWRTETTVPPDDYREKVRHYNPGYDLGFTLTRALLQAHGRPDLHTLVVGAGGGMEIEALLPENPGWRIAGVDVSPPMLATAQHTIERLALQDRVTLHHGSVADLPRDAVFDAATCVYVLFFLPDPASKLALLSATKQRLRPGAPFILIDVIIDQARPFLPASKEYAVIMGATLAESETTIAGFAARAEAASFSEANELALLTEAGFTTIERFFTAYGTVGWLAT